MKMISRTFLVGFVFAAASAIAADGIAFLSNLKGEVAIDGNPRPTLLAEIQKGQRISLGADSHAAVMYIASGKEYALKGPGEYVVKDHEVTSASGAPPLTRETAWRTSNKVLAQVAQTSAASVRMRSIAPAKPAAEPNLIYPVTGSVSTLQPTFRWKGEPKDKADFVLVVAGEEKPVHVAKPMGAAYRVPAKLLPDRDYAWTVTVAGNELGTGKFRTLSPDALAQLERRRPSDKADFSDRLLYALMLQEMGATQEAREAWARLAQERGDLPELAAFAK